MKTNTRDTLPESENPTHGSVWIVQIQPTTDPLSDPQNPTHGSVWIVQVRPTKSALLSFLNPTNGSWWDCSDPALEPSDSKTSSVSWAILTWTDRLDLNNPHTSVCGILGLGECLCCRLDLNNPHTSVCGIPGF